MPAASFGGNNVAVEYFAFLENWINNMDRDVGGMQLSQRPSMEN